MHTRQMLLRNELWNRRILNLLWRFIPISFLAELVIFITYRAQDGPTSDVVYIARYLIAPFAAQLILATGVEVVFRYLGKRERYVLQSYIVVGLSVIMATILCIVHFAVHVIYAIYVLPIIIAVTYIDERLLRSICVMCFVAYTCVLFGYLPLIEVKPGYEHNVMDSITTVTFVISAYIIGRAILSRSEALTEIAVAESRSRRELSQRLKIDVFTGLYNRPAFDEQLTINVQRAEEEHLSFSLIALDIDNFKRVNDTYGHSQGDLVLLALAAAINQSRRDSDLAFRWGGEEFMVLAEGTETGAALLAERIRQAFSIVHIDSMPEESFTVSLGVASFRPGMDESKLFEAADAALYFSKQHGKDQVTIAGHEEDASE